MHILCVAGSMFCQKGYEKVSLRNISETAGVSHSLIRHHFGSKEQIWYAISDSLHEYMMSYISGLIEQFPIDKPANISLYHFATKLLAHTLLIPQPMQFMADAIRHEGEFFDYFIDQSGKFEEITLGLVERHNQENTGYNIKLNELKWQMILFGHGAVSFKPLLNQIWSDETDDPSQALYNHWNLFNQLMVKTLHIPENEVLAPESLDELLLPIACKFSEGYGCQS